MGDQLGIGGVLHTVTNMLAGALSLAALLCIALVIGSIITVARGNAESWTK